MLSPTACVSVDQNKNLLPASTQSFKAFSVGSYSPKSNPIAFCFLPKLIKKSNTFSTVM